MEERVVGIIGNGRKAKSFGRSDTYTLIVTDRRCVFALLTGQMLKDAAQEAQEQGKAEGKGFFARWGAQIASTMGHFHRYREMAPEAALAENEANFALDHSAVRKVNVKRHRGFDDDARGETELKFEGPAGNLSLKFDQLNRDAIAALREVFGDRLKV